MNETIRYPAQVNVKLPEELKEWIPYPQSENIRKILEWAYKDYKEDFNKFMGLIGK